MSTLISAATGNWTDANTWKLVDSVSLLDSLASNTALTVSYAESQPFTPGAITIDGIAIRLASRASGSPSNTISVRLAQGGATVSGTEVTINVADIDVCDTTVSQGGWYLFAFASPVTLLAATAYTVSAKLSATSTAVNLYRDTTNRNWARLLRTTTAQAPVAGDIIHIMGEHTGAGSGNSFVVTQNETGMAVDYGPGTDNNPAMTINKRGTLTFGVSAATNYSMRISGDVIVYSGGTLNQGTVASPMPADSTGFFVFDPVTDGGMGLQIKSGTWVCQGASKTPYVYLGSDAAANAITLTGLSAPSGWRDNDVVCLASTSRSYTECEKGALNGDPSGTTITVDGFAGSGGGVAYAHSGSLGGPAGESTRAELINLTRNVGVYSFTSTIMTWVYFVGSPNIDVDYAEFYYMGDDTTGRRGIVISNTGGTIDIQNFSIHDCEDMGLISSAQVAITIAHLVAWNLNNTQVSQRAIQITCTAGNNYISDFVIMYCRGGGGNTGLFIGVGGGEISNITVVGIYGSSNSFNLSGPVSHLVAPALINNITSHSCAVSGLSVSDSNVLSMSNVKIWRTNSTGMSFSLWNGKLTNVTMFGNATLGISVGGHVDFYNLVANGESAFSTATGLQMLAGGVVRLFNSSLGVSSAHSSQDINLAATLSARLHLYNTILGSSTEVTFSGSGSSYYPALSCVVSHKHDASANYKSFFYAGTIIQETSIRHTASGYAWRMTPRAVYIGVYKLRFPGPSLVDTFKVAVAANQQVTISVWLYKSSTYGGSAPRIVLVGGIVDGITSDVVGSMTVGAETWEKVSVSGTPTENGAVEFYIDCDYGGSGGYILVDDVSVE